MATANGVYADVTGVVDAAAAAEIVDLFVILKSFLPEEGVGGVRMPPPDYCDIPIHTADKLRAEIDAFAVAIAAAPAA